MEIADAVGKVLIDKMDIRLDTIDVADEMILVFTCWMRFIAMEALNSSHRAHDTVAVLFLIIKNDPATVATPSHMMLLA